MTTILRDDSNATATLLEDAGYPLGDIGGVVSLDEGGAPYGVAELTIPLPVDADLLALLDPRAHRRVQIDLTRERVDGFGSTATRSFNLGLRSADITEGGATMQLRLESDEALLMDDVLLADAPLSLHSYSSSLRAVVSAVLARIGATLEAGTADADVTTYADSMNLIPDPSVEFGASGFAPTNCSLDATDTSWAADGARSINLWNPTSSDSYVAIGGGPGGVRLGLQAGKSYVLSATGNVKVALAGAAARTRCLTVIYRVGQSGYVFVDSPPIPAAVNTPGRVSVAFTLPPGTTEAFVRAYLGASTGQVRWDAFRLSEATPNPLDTVFFSGDTPDTAAYDYFWTAASHPTTSSRRALVDRPAASLSWEPGVSAWEFLQPLVQAAGMRLLCDEDRKWWLLDGAGYLAPGVTQLSFGAHMLEAASGVSRDGDWYDAALVRYRWTDAAGISQERIDWYAEPGYTKARLFDIDAPYPGPGRAEYKVKRAEGLGRTATVRAPLDVAVTPSQALRLNLPNLPELFGVTRSVDFNLDDFTMTLESRGLTDVPPGAWVLVNPALVWASVDPALVWADATPDDSTIFD